MNFKFKSYVIKINPFYLYSLSLTIILVLYNLKWSDLYPSISNQSYLFFIATIIISIFLGRYIEKREFHIEEKERININVNLITLLICIFMIVDFAYAGSIPLIEIAIIKKANYTHFDFRGIPLLHGFFISFVSFFAIYLYYKFLNEKNLKYIFLFFVNFIPGILLYNRGMITMILISCVSVYILTKLKGVLSFKYLLILSIPIIIFLYAFGILGNLRQNKDIPEIKNIYTNSEYIMHVGGASRAFRDSNIPKAYYWSYIYMTSPLANLENTIQNKPPYVKPSLENSIKFLNFSILPNFISEKLNLEYEQAALISPSLTVSTAYSEAYTFLGWIGIIILFIYWILLVITYNHIMPKNSEFFITGVSVLNTITMLNFFDNMMVFSPLSFQLIYPVIFMIVFEKKWLNNFYQKIKRKLV